MSTPVSSRPGLLPVLCNRARRNWSSNFGLLRRQSHLNRSGKRDTLRQCKTLCPHHANRKKPRTKETFFTFSAWIAWGWCGWAIAVRLCLQVGDWTLLSSKPGHFDRWLEVVWTISKESLLSVWWQQLWIDKRNVGALVQSLVVRCCQWIWNLCEISEAP